MSDKRPWHKYNLEHANRKESVTGKLLHTINVVIGQICLNGIVFDAVAAM